MVVCCATNLVDGSRMITRGPSLARRDVLPEALLGGLDGGNDGTGGGSRGDMMVDYLFHVALSTSTR